MESRFCCDVKPSKSSCSGKMPEEKSCTESCEVEKNKKAIICFLV